MHSLFNKRNILTTLLITYILAIVTCHIPITYDEAWNYINISSKGILYSITNYPVPNNHVLFSAIQSILINERNLELSPFCLRISNILIVFFFILFLIKIFNFYKIDKNKYIFFIFFLIFSSQLVTIYFFIARGYLIGTLLCFMGIFYWGIQNRKIGLFFLTLSVWTVPTFCYIWPGIFLYKIIKDKKIINVFFDAILLFSTTVIVYLPIIKQIYLNRNRWITFANLNNFYHTLFFYLNNFKNVYISAIEVTLIGMIILLNKDTKIKTFCFLLSSSIISYVAISTVFKLFNLSNLPFARNGIFIPFFINFQIILSLNSLSKKNTKTIIYTFLTINTLIGYCYLYNYILYKKKYDTIIDLAPTVLISGNKQILENSKTILYYHADSGPVAVFYAKIYNIEPRKAEGDYFNCDIGKILPSVNEKITLIDKNDKKINLCY